MGSIFTIGTAIMTNTIRAEGNSRYSMIATCIGAIINIILDPILMFNFNMGIKRCCSCYSYSSVCVLYFSF